jgi:GNAT superfamily N-acetyltransferase
MINIRLATIADTQQIARFNSAMALATEDKHLSIDTLTQGVSGLLAHPEFGFYLVAEVDSQPVASLMITYEWSDWRNGLFWWIQSLYVLPKYRKQGIYKSMYQYLQDLASKEKATVVGFRLYVDKDNSNAQQVYKRCGMDSCHYQMFEQTV